MTGTKIKSHPKAAFYINTNYETLYPEIKIYLISVRPHSQESELECSLARHAKSPKSGVYWCT